MDTTAVPAQPETDPVLPDVPVVDLEAAAEEEPLAVKVEREIKEGRMSLPVMPAVALEVRRLISEERGMPEIVSAIEKDPAIAAALVKYANSVVYEIGRAHV